MGACQGKGERGERREKGGSEGIQPYESINRHTMSENHSMMKSQSAALKDMQQIIP